MSDKDVTDAMIFFGGLLLLELLIWVPIAVLCF
jgi:hypothetical protein